MSKLFELARYFAREEDGASLAEYLVLLGMLTVVLVAAVTSFGGAMASAFTSWAGWIKHHACSGAGSCS